MLRLNGRALAGFLVIAAAADAQTPLSWEQIRERFRHDPSIELGEELSDVGSDAINGTRPNIVGKPLRWQTATGIRASWPEGFACPRFYGVHESASDAVK
jgi:hypothetical protein